MIATPEPTTLYGIENINYNAYVCIFCRLKIALYNNNLIIFEGHINIGKLKSNFESLIFICFNLKIRLVWLFMSVWR